jgi:hypothetical protein
MTVAALRRAWVSDPVIRDFIGIAENQWDFTNPTYDDTWLRTAA